MTLHKSSLRGDFISPWSAVVMVQPTSGAQYELSQTFPVPPSPTSTSLKVGGALGAASVIMSTKKLDFGALLG